MRHIVDDFNQFLGRDLGMERYDYHIISQSVYSKENLSLAIVKLEVTGKREGGQAVAYVNYILSVKSEVKLIYSSDFFQPECGTPDFNILSISNLRINEMDYPTLERESRKLACCKQATEVQIDWLLFAKSFKDQQTILEKFYHNDNLMDCGPSNHPPSESRDTEYFFENSGLTAEVTFLQEDKKINSKKRKVTFDE